MFRNQNLSIRKNFKIRKNLFSAVGMASGKLERHWRVHTTDNARTWNSTARSPIARQSPRKNVEAGLAAAVDYCYNNNCVVGGRDSSGVCSDVLVVRHTCYLPSSNIIIIVFYYFFFESNIREKKKQLKSTFFFLDEKKFAQKKKENIRVLNEFYTSEIVFTNIWTVTYNYQYFFLMNKLNFIQIYIYFTSLFKFITNSLCTIQRPGVVATSVSHCISLGAYIIFLFFKFFYANVIFFRVLFTYQVIYRHIG